MLQLSSTYHHPYWVVEGQDLGDRPKPDHVAAAEVPNATVPGRWVDAGDLRVGDVLLLMDGRRVPIEEILVRQVVEKVYNFQVHGLHNYAVGPDRVLVHNSCGDVTQAGKVFHYTDTRGALGIKQSGQLGLGTPISLTPSGS